MITKSNTITFGLLFMSVFVLSGCIVGIVYDSFDKTIPAEHEIADVPTLVFIEDDSGLVRRSDTLHRIRSLTGNYIVMNEALSQKNLIDPSRVDFFAKHEKDFKRWSITKIGRKVGAEQVIRLRVVDFKLRDAQVMVRPEIGLRVKLIDVKNNKVLYPTSRDGRYVYAKGTHEYIDDGRHATETYAAEITSDRVAEKAARLFYEHIQPAGNTPD